MLFSETRNRDYFAQVCELAPCGTLKPPIVLLLQMAPIYPFKKIFRWLYFSHVVWQKEQNTLLYT